MNTSLSLHAEYRIAAPPSGEISLAQQALRPNTIRMRNTAAKCYFWFKTGEQPAWGNDPETMIRPVSLLQTTPPTPKDLVDFIRWMHRVRGYSTQTARAYVSHLNSLMRQAFDESPRSAGKVKAELAAYGKLRPSIEHHSKPITMDLLGRMLRNVRSDYYRTLFVLSYTFSLRASEALAICGDDIKIGQKGRVMLTIPFSKTSRIPVELCQILPSTKVIGFSAANVLAQIKAMTGTARVFRIGHTGFNAAIKEAARRAGEEDWQGFSSHGFRTGRITDMIMAGASDRDTAMVSRHNDLEMLRTYYRPDQHDTQAAVAAKVNEHYEQKERGD